MKTGPHSRACGWKEHAHGFSCHSNCPTCHGKELVMKTYIGKVYIEDGVLLIRPIFDDERVIGSNSDRFISITTVVDLDEYRTNG